MTFRWTAEAKATVAERLVAGDTAAQIGKIIGVSRSAITGLMARDSKLAGIGFARTGKSFQGGKTSRFTPEERAARKRQYMAAYDQRRRKGTNVIPFPAPCRKRPVASPPKPVQRVVSNNVPLMVQDWLAKNGGPRRFKDRETSDCDSIREFLAKRDIMIRRGRGNCGNRGNRGNWGGGGGVWAMSRGPGRPKVMSWAAVMEIVDDLRLAEGLQPFARQQKTG